MHGPLNRRNPFQALDQLNPTATHVKDTPSPQVVDLECLLLLRTYTQTPSECATSDQSLILSIHNSQQGGLNNNLLGKIELVDQQL